jgi:hypothetical protein
MEAPQKTKNRFVIQSSKNSPRDIPEGMWVRLQQRHLYTHIYWPLFTLTKLWKQPKCTTTDEWIKQIGYLHTVEFYSATKKNEILSFPGKWMELENIIFSEVSLAQKAKNHMFCLLCGI